MARPLLRQAALAGLLVATAVAGVAHAALVEVGGTYAPVNALNVGESTQNNGAQESDDSGGAMLVDVWGFYTPVNAGNVGTSTQNNGDAGSDGSSPSGLIVVGGNEMPINILNVGTSTQNNGGSGSGGVGVGPGPTLIRIGGIFAPINVLNVEDSCQSTGATGEVERCDPNRPTEPLIDSAGLVDPGPAPGPGPNPSPNPNPNPSPNPGPNPNPAPKPSPSPAPGPGTTPGNPGTGDPGSGNAGTNPGTGTMAPAPTRNGGTGPASQVSGSTLEVAGAPLGLAQMRPEVGPTTTLGAPAAPAPAVAPGGELPGAGPGMLGRTGFPIKAVATLGLLLILAGTLLALTVRRAAPARRPAPAR